MKVDYLQWSKDEVRKEWKQLQQEGCDCSALEAQKNALLQEEEVERTPEFQQKVDAFLDQAQELPYRADNPWDEPDELAEIRARRPAPVVLPALEPSALAGRMAGAWLGRCAGCWLGKPIEGWRTPQLHKLYAAVGVKYPDNYLWMLPLAENTAEEFKFWSVSQAQAVSLEQYRREADGMPADDDVNYTIAGLCLIEKHGIDFTPEHMARFWLENLPAAQTCTAERVAYRNFLNCVTPPMSARVRNPYREWIGAQIRADFFGYVAPGKPELAAELAWRDACISHVKNGIYGEMWVAAMLAAAAVTADMPLIIRAGLAQIPQNCRLAASIREVLALYEAGKPYDDAITLLRSAWDENEGVDWCHTISNAMIVAAALLWGGRNTDLVLGLSIWPGFDTDCNGATAGSVAGMAYGEGAFAQKWREPLNDKIHSGIAGNTLVSLQELVRRSLACVDKVCAV